MVYRFYGKYGELARIKLWTKTGEKELSHTIRLEHHPVTNEVRAYVRCALVVQVPEFLDASKVKEIEYPICVCEKYSALLTTEEFKKKEKELKVNIVENVKKNYGAISAEIRSIWKWD